MGSVGVAWKQLQEHASIFALDSVVVCMVTTRPPKTIVESTALGPVANTDTKLLIYGLFQRAEFWHRTGLRAPVSRKTSIRDHKGIVVAKKMSRKVSRRVVRPACIAGVRISRPNFRAPCGSVADSKVRVLGADHGLAPLGDSELDIVDVGAIGAVVAHIDLDTAVDVNPNAIPVTGGAPLEPETIGAVRVPREEVRSLVVLLTVGDPSQTKVWRVVRIRMELLNMYTVRIRAVGPRGRYCQVEADSRS